MKNLVKWALASLIACVIFALPLTAFGEDEVKIYTYEDLFLIAENPGGNFILMNDIDCSGQKEWTPVDFTGTFDGNGHGILNLSITGVSNEIRTTYDGNMKTYDTCFGGLFGCLENASVKNLTLYGVNVDIDVDADCFIGTIAGYSDNSTIDNCDIYGTASLKVQGAMFGVGGVVGFGNGAILNAKSETTLICVDKDATTRDEQFMGGAYAAGYIDLDNDDITVHGFDSDHGYVHDGGLVGMYGLYPAGHEYAGYITNTWSRGKITFFEDNTNRRAYCSEICGEVLNWTYAFSGCHADFVRDERFDYNTDLYPHGDCGAEISESSIFEGSCEEFGYTEHKCSTCGYSYKDSFTLKNHALGEAEHIVLATEENTGLDKMTCSVCGAEVYAVSEKIKPTPTPTPEAEEENIEETEANNGGSLGIGVLILIVLAIGASVAALVTAFLYLSKNKKRRNRRK